MIGINNSKSKIQKVMKKNSVSFFIACTLCLTSFIPIMQVVILYLNGAIIEMFKWIFNSKEDKVIYIIDVLFSMFFSFLFYASHKRITKILSAIGVVIFFLPLLIFLTENKFNSESLYFLPFLLVGFVIGVWLILIEYLGNVSK